MGKVRDVQIVRDPRSGRSKGVGYVEFYSPESVLMAMTLTGTKLMGQEIMVQASQAEKNRAAAAAKYKKEVQEKSRPGESSEGPMRIAIEGLAELLESVSEGDLFKVLCGVFNTFLYSSFHHLALSITSTCLEPKKTAWPLFSSNGQRMPKRQ